MIWLVVLTTILFFAFLVALFSVSEPLCKKCKGRLTYWGSCRWFCDDCGEENK